jgi:hypothetical protein
MNYRMSRRNIISAAVGSASLVAVFLLNSNVVAVAGPWPYVALFGAFGLAVGWSWRGRGAVGRASRRSQPGWARLGTASVGIWGRAR